MSSLCRPSHPVDVLLQGTITVPDLSQEQVDGMAGGDALRSQTLAFGMVRNMKQLQKGAARLLAALQQVHNPTTTFLTLRQLLEVLVSGSPQSVEVDSNAGGRDPQCQAAEGRCMPAGRHAG